MYFLTLKGILAARTYFKSYIFCRWKVFLQLELTLKVVFLPLKGILADLTYFKSCISAAERYSCIVNLNDTIYIYHFSLHFSKLKDKLVYFYLTKTKILDIFIVTFLIFLASAGHYLTLTLPKISNHPYINMKIRRNPQLRILSMILSFRLLFYN